MKKLILTLIAGATIAVSCSKDKIVEELTDGLIGDEEANALVGVWELSEFKYDTQAGGTNVNLAEDILNKFKEENCVVVTFDFKEDGSLMIESGMNYLEINATPTGLQVPCPTQKDEETTTYTYEDGVLTFKDADGADVVVKATVDGDELTADASDLDLNENFNYDGDLIFVKKE